MDPDIEKGHRNATGHRDPIPIPIFGVKKDDNGGIIIYILVLYN
jgi:hypothetical protein